MVFRSFEELIAHAKESAASAGAARVVVAGADDAHTLEAVGRAAAEGIVAPVLVGEEDAVRAAAVEANFPLEDAVLHPAADAAGAAARAVELVREGEADFIMKGRLETSDILRAVVNKETGLSRGRVMSHVAINEIPAYHKLLITTDGGMLLAPTLEQKRDVVMNAVDMLRSLGYDEPKVGILAAAERVNPKSVDSTDAAALKEAWEAGELPGCILEGPISFDLATVPARAVAKRYESPVAGDADVLVVPNITAGNILGKSLVEMAGAKMAGLVVGATCPIVVTSRGSSSEEKYNALALAASMRS